MAGRTPKDLQNMYTFSKNETWEQLITLENALNGSDARRD